MACKTLIRKFNIIKKTVNKVFLPVIFICINCKSSISRIASSEFEITVSYPIYYADRNLLTTITDTVPIITFREWNIYCMPYILLSKEKDEVIEKQMFNYFVFKKNRKYGFFLKDTHDLPFKQKLLVDSIITKYQYLKSKEFNTKGMLLVYRSNKNPFTEIYIPDSPKKGNSVDTVKLYFEPKLNSVDFSLSETLDSTHKMKLTKVVMIFNAMYLKEIHNTIPPREMIFEIRIPDKSRKMEILPIIDLLKYHPPDDY